MDYESNPENIFKLEQFIGMSFNEETKNKILNIFPNYTFDECHNDNYYNEYYCDNSIRVLVKNNIIEEISFG